MIFYGKKQVSAREKASLVLIKILLRARLELDDFGRDLQMTEAEALEVDHWFEHFQKIAIGSVRQENDFTKLLRLANARYTQREIGSALRVSFVTVSTWVRGTRLPHKMRRNRYQQRLVKMLKGAMK